MKLHYPLLVISPSLSPAALAGKPAVGSGNMIDIEMIDG